MRPVPWTAQRCLALGAGLALAGAWSARPLRAQAEGQTLFVENTNSGDVSVIDNASVRHGPAQYPLGPTRRSTTPRPRC